jgi:ribonuclease HI
MSMQLTFNGVIDHHISMSIIYTDGSCRPTNPGPGGWGVVLVGNDHDLCLNGGSEWTTNNRMELQAVIEGLLFTQSVKNVTIYSDSCITIQCAKGVFKRKKNLDLWKDYDTASEGRTVRWVKVKAHSGEYYNEMVDQLAKDGASEFIMQKKFLNGI